MPARKPEPTKSELVYLRELEAMRRDKVCFGFGVVAKRLGLAISSVFQVHTQLISKGLLLPADPETSTWLVYAPAPTVTPKAKRYLKAA